MTTNEDSDGLEFISSLEHAIYPLYGLQFHPEKNIYEWAEDRVHSHSADAIRVSQYFANFFVNEGKKEAKKRPRKLNVRLTCWEVPSTIRTALGGFLVSFSHIVLYFINKQHG
jgi:hypothetical protein